MSGLKLGKAWIPLFSKQSSVNAVGTTLLPTPVALSR
jgi:hypothetical protein